MNKKFTFLFLISLLMVLSGSLNPWVYKGDSGELILTSKFLGVSHPSGYPLYNILTKPFLEIPGLKPTIAMSFSSLFFLCLTALFTMLTLELLLEDIIFSITGAITLSFGVTFLRTGLSQEIYSLFTMFFSICLYFFIRWIIFKEKKFIFAAAFSLGLLSAVHVTGLFYFVFFLILYLIFDEKRDIKTVFLLLLYYSLPCTLYLFLMIRDTAFFSWGDTSSITKVFSHMSGSERGVGNRFFAFSFKEYLHQLTVFLHHVSKEFFFLWVFLIPGIVFLFKYEKRYLISITGPFVICTFFYTLVARNLEYRQHFFLISFYAIFLLCWAGVFWAHRYIFKKKKALYLLVFPLILFLINKPDFSYGAMLDSYSYNLDVTTSQTKDNVLLTEGDEATFILWYSKYMEGRFKDTLVINRDMLSSAWYREKYGELKQIIKDHSHIYTDEYSGDLFYDKYIASYGIIYSIEDEYKTPETEIFRKYRLNGLDKKYELPEVEAIRLRYRDSYNQTGIELMKAGRAEEAKKMFESALKIKADLGVYSNLSKASSGKTFYNDTGEMYLDKKQFGKAKDYFKKKGDIDSLARLYWKLEDYSKLETLENIPDFYKGILLFRKGDYHKAAVLFSSGNTRDSLFYLALSLNALGQREKAIIILQNLYNKAPDREIHDALKNLKGYVSIY
ncbi:MAG: hypothetical protein C0601_02520 [Candidatus Muiribacterium halophilum]|uniref:Uncharacterized protein n=1 Tax=Muiribacterium halophilum TaxID=2053465 RepID=A0A2N5ZKR3_MUIH1|nr:MAG: hypothetical protein C0601_02520 [Candidatus Muirbacterium halophilum]